MLVIEQFEQYFQVAQELVCRARYDASVLNELFQLIEEERQRFCADQSYEEFFAGEFAFYRHRYREALKHYLLAPNVPYFKLFCYRATAYVAKEAGEKTKALNFAKKALEVFSEDYASLQLLREIVEENELEGIEKHLELLDQQHLVFSSEDKETKCQTSPCYVQSHPFSAVAADFTESLESLSCPLRHRLYKTGTSLEEKAVDFFSNQNKDKKNNYNFVNTYKSDSLDGYIHSFYLQQTAVLNQYIDSLKHRSIRNEQALYVLYGWHGERDLDHNRFLLDRRLQSSGGYFIRWGGKGIVINPGRHFLEAFHKQELHIKDIDYVIVTNPAPSAYGDLSEIYELNYKINKVCAQKQIIEYYLHPMVHLVTAHNLKPHFKEERHTVHSLEQCIDTKELERIELDRDIILEYFFPGKENGDAHKRFTNEESTLGIKLKFKREHDFLTIGYITDTPYIEEVIQPLQGCDMMIVGFGYTEINDYQKKEYLEGCLGYYGIYSLLTALQSRLWIISEFLGTNGDIRLEVIRQLRGEFLEAYPDHAEYVTILPADPSLCIDLKSFDVQCSLTGQMVSAANLHLGKPFKLFGAIQYLSANCLV